MRWVRLAILAAALGHAEHATGQECTPFQVLTAPDSHQNHFFGTDVELEDEVAVVGCYNDSHIVTNGGAVYLYRLKNDAWELEQKITAPTPHANDRFGTSVALEGDRLLVGAPGDPYVYTSPGRVYFYQYIANQWELKQQFTGSSTSNGDYFGQTIEIQGGCAMIAATNDRIDNIAHGSLYVFGFDGAQWSESQKVNANGVPSGSFGASIAISGSTAIIGSPGESVDAYESGAVYVLSLTKSGWIQTEKLTQRNGALRDWFGIDVAVDGTHCLISALRTGTDAPGEVHFYEFNGDAWVEVGQLLPTHLPADEWYGKGLALEGTLALVGASFDEDQLTDAGVAYLFEFDGVQWNEQQKIAPSIPQVEGFGGSVDISGKRALISAATTDISAINAGAVYLLDNIPFADCNSNLIVDDCELTDGAMDKNGNLTLDECEPLCDLFDRLVPIPSQPLDQAGAALAYSEGTLAMGAPGSGNLSGSVSIWVKGARGFEQVQLIEGQHREDQFGASLGLSTSTLAVGAPELWVRSTNEVGAVHLFEREGAIWVASQVLHSSDSPGFTRFGVSIDLEKDWLAIGSENLAQEQTLGHVYIFKRVGSEWIEMQKLSAPDEEVAQRFGACIDISDDRMLVGAPGVPWKFPLPGKAFLFRLVDDSWVLDASFQSVAPRGIDLFGSAVVVDNDKILIGAPYEGNNPVQVFSFNGFEWEYSATLKPVNPGYGFGNAIDYSNGIALIGASVDDPFGAQSGSAYVFQLTPGGWVQEQTMIPADGALFCRFGTSVQLCNDAAIVGSPGSLWDDDYPGKVYVQTVVPAIDCNGNFEPDICEIQGGWVADTNRNGVPDECDPIEVLGDVDGNGVVNVDDLLAIIAAWGPCKPPPADCAEDIAPDKPNGAIDVDDLLVVINNWS